VKHRAGRSRARHRPAHSSRRRRRAKRNVSSAELTTTELRDLRRLLAAEDSRDPAHAIANAETTEIPIVDAGADPGPGSRGRVRRALLGTGRGIVALVSAAILVSTGFGWAGLSNLQSNLNTTDALDELHELPGSPAPEDGATDILLVGSDSRTDANGNPLPLDVLKLLRTEESSGLNTDTMILVRVPNNGGRAVAISIPRDTYVEIPGYRADKINAAYGAGKRIAHDKLEADGVTDERVLERDSNQAGRRSLVQVMQNLTGVRVDHYAEINLYGFYLLTEAIGGIEVCLKRATKDPDSGADFRAGRQLVAGGDALAFVRQRGNLPRGDLDRIVRQQVFMAAVANRVLSTGTLTDPSRLSGLLDATQKAVVLDSGWDVLGFAQQMQGIAAGSVEFVTIPVLDVGARNERGQSIITIDQAAVHTFVSGLLGGPALPAPPPTSTRPAPPPPTVDPSSVTVDVANGTRRPGLATRVTDILSSKGFRTGEPDNMPLRQTSEVRVAPGARPVGDQIAAALGGIPIVEDPSLPTGRALVMIGSDYEGPGAQTLGAPGLVQLDPPAAVTFQSQQPPADADAPITAGGITCVN
jgi:LCP family protein required for cell wall assembly